MKAMVHASVISGDPVRGKARHSGRRSQNLSRAACRTPEKKRRANAITGRRAALRSQGQVPYTTLFSWNLAISSAE